MRGLFRAFAGLPPPLRNSYQIVVANKEQHELKRMAAECGIHQDELAVCGHVADEDLVALYNLCDLMVFPSLDEGFGLPALEAMTCGAPTIGSRAASIPEVIGLEEALFDPSDVTGMTQLIQQGLQDEAFRKRLTANAARRSGQFSWDRSAVSALEAMEDVQKKHVRPAEYVSGFSECLTSLAKLEMDSAGLRDLATALAWNFPAPGRHRQLLVDVSELAQRDARTGCQRVARSVLLQWLRSPPEGVSVEPIYATDKELGYRYANSFRARLLGLPVTEPDHPIDFAVGDVFFGLDFQIHVVLAQAQTLEQMRVRGVRVWFLLYDLLPCQMPKYFHQMTTDEFSRWLERDIGA